MEIEVILNRPIDRLGKIGDLVKVKAGYGMNYLFPNGFAVPANARNKENFEKKKSVLLKEHEQHIAFAKRVVKECDKQWFTIVKRSNYDGSLYGAVSAHDVWLELHKVFSEIDKKIIKIPFIIRKLGIYDLKVVVYDDIQFLIKINVANSIGEAEEAKKRYIDDQMNADVAKKAEEIRDNFEKKDDNQ